jgi:hypothetical protein
MREAVKDPRTFEVTLENREGEQYIGRITGALIDQEGDIEVYLTDDERVIVYDGYRLSHEVLDPEQVVEGGLMQRIGRCSEILRGRCRRRTWRSSGGDSKRGSRETWRRICGSFTRRSFAVGSLP